MRIVALLALVAVLVWLSFVGMASPAHAQGPTPTPSGPSPLLPLGPPARITVHPRPRLLSPTSAESGPPPWSQASASTDFFLAEKAAPQQAASSSEPNAQVAASGPNTAPQ
jgi:hypothetical protein